jgi:hypothetical protein
LESAVTTFVDNGDAEENASPPTLLPRLLAGLSVVKATSALGGAYAGLLSNERALVSGYGTAGGGQLGVVVGGVTATGIDGFVVAVLSIEREVFDSFSVVIEAALGVARDEETAIGIGVGVGVGVGVGIGFRGGAGTDVGVEVGVGIGAACGTPKGAPTDGDTVMDPAFAES